MAFAANLLETRTSNFLELIGNRRIYRVPPYQRDYSWEEEQWDDLWSDIEELSNEKRHYMGAVVVEAKSDREFLIIDGQQRLATLSILTLAIIDTLLHLGGTDSERTDNQTRALSLRDRYIGEKDPVSLLESSKLFLNENNDGFYQDNLVQLRKPHNVRKLSHSNHLLWDCFNWFKGRLQAKQLDGGGLAQLLDTVARQLLFILVTVDDDLNAYTVFETLNARGLELSVTDLLKNYLFSRFSVKSELDFVQRQWKGMLQSVASERFPDFLRYHLLCDTSRIRKGRLFKLVRERVKDAAGVLALMDVLTLRAELFAAFNDPNDPLWIGDRRARSYIRALQIFRVQQMTPLLFAAWEKLSQEDFIRVLKLLNVISFRYTVICGYNANELEPAYHYAAKALLNGQATTPAHVFKSLERIYVPDEKFISAFADKDIDTDSTPRKRLAKYILCHLEADISGKPCDDESDPASIEHILPENPSQEWDQTFPPEHQDRSIYRLGNLTLLEDSLNRRLHNSPFIRKKTAYTESAYALTRALIASTPDEWTPAVLQRRQQDMADRAAHIWRADFA